MNEKTSIVQLQLGEGYQTIQRQSTCHFPQRALTSIDAVTISGPVAIVYTHQEHQFELPASRITSISFNNNHAVGFTTSPHLSYLSFEDAIALIRNLIQLFDRLGNETLSRAFDIEDIASFFETTKRSDARMDIERWRLGDDFVRVRLERRWQSDDSLPVFLEYAQAATSEDSPANTFVSDAGEHQASQVFRTMADALLKGSKVDNVTVEGYYVVTVKMYNRTVSTQYPG